MNATSFGYSTNSMIEFFLLYYLLLFLIFMIKLQAVYDALKMNDIT